MQTIGKESYISEEGSKSQFNPKRNAIRGSQHICDDSHTNNSENCHSVDKCKLQPEFNERQIESEEEEEEIIFHFSDEVIDSEMKRKTKDIPYDRSKRAVSPIEEVRTDGKDWQYLHRSTSTPISNKNIFPDLNISSISSEESDSDILYERQISRFQITDEFINYSSVFDDSEDKQH